MPEEAPSSSQGTLPHEVPQTPQKAQKAPGSPGRLQETLGNPRRSWRAAARCHSLEAQEAHLLSRSCCEGPDHDLRRRGRLRTVEISVFEPLEARSWPRGSRRKGPLRENDNCERWGRRPPNPAR